MLQSMPAPTIWLSTLGCAKNQVDSEKLVAMLSEAGYGWADAPEQADVVMVNTCAFIEEARAESIDAILDLEDRKRGGARSVVIGCMAQRFGSEVAAALPEVDAVLGIDRYGELVGVLDDLTRWHAVRKAAKAVRYGSEVLVPVLGPAAERHAEAWSDVTTVFGEVQDAVIAGQLVSELWLEAEDAGLPTAALDEVRHSQDRALHEALATGRDAVARELAAPAFPHP